MEKEKDVTFEELAAIGKPMVEGHLLQEESQSQRDLMEEEVAMIPCKNKKKKRRMGLGQTKL